MQYTVNDIYLAKALINETLELIKISNSALRKLVRDIAEYMLNSLDKAKREAARKAIMELYKNKGKKAEWKRVDKILDELRANIGTQMTKLNEKPILQIETEVYKEGVKEVDTHLSFSAQDRRALNLVHDQHMFWIGDHYNSYIHKTVVENFKSYIEKGLTNEQLANMFETAFSGLVDRKKNYYQGLAEHITSRLRTFANVKGYVKSGIKGLRISAILDGRTTNICREMNGRIFVTERLNSFVDKAISVTSEKELRKMLPMRSGNDVKGIAGIPSSSIPVADQLPPYHWRCRTRTVAYFEEFETPEERIIKNINNYEVKKKDIESLQKMAIQSDMKGKVVAKKDSSKFGFKKGQNIDSWVYHADKHMDEFNVKNLAEYKEKVYNIIRNPEKVNIGINKTGEVIVFFTKNGLTVKTSPMKDSIYTAYKIHAAHNAALSQLAKGGEIK